MASRSTSNTTSVINLLAGIWLIISPFVLNYSSFGVSSTNAIIVGVLVAILALIKLANYESNWAGWVNFLLGLWMIIAPFAMGHGSIGTVVTNEVILGIIVAASSLTSALAGSSMQMET
jgi:hypothetical protein